MLDKGSLADAVLASNSLPGMLSPMLIEGELFVDGGLTNTMPVDMMKKKYGGTTIAVNVSQERNIEFDMIDGLFPSSMAILFNRLNPFRPL
jgi:NTE family protein